MIEKCVDIRAFQRRSSGDDHAVIGCCHLTSHRLQVIGDSLDPVGLLYFQFRSVFDDSGSLRCGCHDSDDRNLVDQGGDDIPFDPDAVQLAGADKDVGDFLSAFRPFIQQGDVPAHVLAHFEDACAGGVDPYSLDQDLGIRNDQSCRNEISGGGDIPGDGKFLPVQFIPGADGSRCPGAANLKSRADVRAEFFEHKFSMVSGEGRLCDRSFTFCVKPCQQNAGFNLS